MANKVRSASKGQGAGNPVKLESMMRAVVQKSYGGADVLHLAQIDRPRINADEVLVRVHAAGLDRGTWHLMTGRPYLMRLVFGLRRPRNPVSGLDLAGTVAAVGAAVTRFRVGEEVFGFGQGSLAEYAAAKESKLAHKPENISFEQAAVVPVSAVTALQGLRDAGHLQTGQKVLITGASGGVGSYAVQLAKALGAEVTGVCSTAKMSLVRSLGADHAIDYSRNDFADDSSRYDLILDLAGQDLPIGAGGGGHAVPRSWKSSRKNRHHSLNATKRNVPPSTAGVSWIASRAQVLHPTVKVLACSAYGRSS